MTSLQILKSFTNTFARNGGKFRFPTPLLSASWPNTSKPCWSTNVRISVRIQFLPIHHLRVDKYLQSMRSTCNDLCTTWFAFGSKFYVLNSRFGILRVRSFQNVDDVGSWLAGIKLECTTSYKFWHETSWRFRGFGLCVRLFEQPAFNLASGDIGTSDFDLFLLSKNVFVPPEVDITGVTLCKI